MRNIWIKAIVLHFVVVVCMVDNGEFVKYFFSVSHPSPSPFLNLLFKYGRLLAFAKNTTVLQSTLYRHVGGPKIPKNP